MASIYFLSFAGLALLSFFLARARAKSLAGERLMMHSRPSYHGLFLASLVLLSMLAVFILGWVLIAWLAENRALAALPAVRSVAQLGNRLRVLVHRDARDPERELGAALASHCPDARVERVAASLEDVFVAATRLQSATAAAEERAA